MSRRTKGCLGCGAMLGAFIFMVILGLMVGPQKEPPAAGAAPASRGTVATSGQPSPSVTTAATPKPSATPSASAPMALPSTGPTHLAAAGDRHKAAAILRASDAYYQQVFNAGVPVILDRGQPNSFPAFAVWQQAHGQGDVQEGMTAFKQADAFFTADDEPSTISDWQGDNGQLSSDIAQLDNDGDGVGGPDDATYRAKVQADVTQFQKDFATAEKDADNVEAGR
jgi:hypothetical protein